MKNYSLLAGVMFIPLSGMTKDVLQQRNRHQARMDLLQNHAHHMEYQATRRVFRLRLEDEKRKEVGLNATRVGVCCCLAAAGCFGICFHGAFDPHTLQLIAPPTALQHFAAECSSLCMTCALSAYVVACAHCLGE